MVLYQYLNFLILIIVLWLCKRISLFLGNTHSRIKRKGEQCQLTLKWLQTLKTSLSPPSHPHPTSNQLTSPAGCVLNPSSLYLLPCISPACIPVQAFTCFSLGSSNFFLCSRSFPFSWILHINVKLIFLV